MHNIRVCKQTEILQILSKYQNIKIFKNLRLTPRFWDFIKIFAKIFAKYSFALKFTNTNDMHEKFQEHLCPC